jgi:hypothetical protein
LFCSSACEKKHDLFKSVEREGLALAEPVKVSQLTPEELEKYRNQTKKIGRARNLVELLIGDGLRTGVKMDKEQLEWQRKIIKEEYMGEPKRLSNNVTLPAAPTLPNRRDKRIK